MNTDHLWIGSNADNVADMKAKGRNGGNIGRRDANLMSKVTSAQIVEMRALKAAGMRVKDIAFRFGLSRNHAGRLMLRLRDGQTVRSLYDGPALPNDEAQTIIGGSHG